MHKSKKFNEFIQTSLVSLEESNGGLHLCLYYSQLILKLHEMTLFFLALFVSRHVIT
jgi:hypothetical protein